MHEFREIYELPAARFSRSDIEKLGQLISGGLRVKPGAFDFSLSDGVKKHRASSLDDLLSQELPQSIDALSFEALGWTDDDNIDRSVRVDVSRTFAQCHIFSQDEVWFSGKAQQIKELFSGCSPWYGKIRPAIPGVIGALEGISVFLLGFFLLSQQFFFSAISGLTLLVLFRFFWSFSNGRLFPLVDIELSQKRRGPDRETIMVFFIAIGALASVVGVLVRVLR
jgi:hypothetical protein